jgi:hypothetical protein
VGRVSRADIRRCIRLSVVEARDDRPDVRLLPLADDDVVEHAGVIRLVLHGGLVALDLDEDVADGDVVARVLVPDGYRALLHRVGETWHEDVDHDDAL